MPAAHQSTTFRSLVERAARTTRASCTASFTTTWTSSTAATTARPVAAPRCMTRAAGSRCSRKVNARLSRTMTILAVASSESQAVTRTRIYERRVETTAWFREPAFGVQGPPSRGGRGDDPPGSAAHGGRDPCLLHPRAFVLRIPVRGPRHRLEGASALQGDGDDSRRGERGRRGHHRERTGER